MENSFFVQPIDMPDICAYIMHFYACIIHKMPISEIYAWQKYMYVRNIRMLGIRACIMHSYACIMHNMCMLEINAWQKYIHVRNISMLGICACMIHFYACTVQNMCMLEINVCRNIYVLETYLHVRNMHDRNKYPCRHATSNF